MNLLRRLWLWVLLGAVLAGCSEPRTLEEIEAEMRTLPTLYLTEESRQRVTAPATKGMHVHEETGEIAYQPYECLNPNCPGRTPEGNYLFVHRNVLVTLDEEGNFVYGTVPEGADYTEYVESKGGFVQPTCPKCLELRDRETENEEEKKQYQEWVRPYELPETVKRRQQLEKEHEEAHARLEKKRRGE